MSVTEHIKLRPLSKALGAEIQGIDLRRLSDEDAHAIVDAWIENFVILLRNQDLSEDEQVRFAERFGDGQLSAAHIPGLGSKKAGVAYVSNIRQDGKLTGVLPDGEMQFHSDQCYLERPSKGTMLYAIEVPSKGGDTVFANAYAAYETLPKDVRQRIAEMTALNVYDYGNNPTRRGEVSADAPQWVHPVVRTHPVTGRKALFVNRLMTVRIEGLAAGESAELLDMLFAHSERPQFIYAHVWRPGDVLVWDNRCVLHARTDFDSSERRLLRRITLQPEGVQ